MPLSTTGFAEPRVPSPEPRLALPCPERVRRVDPRGRVYFWTGPGFDCPEPHPDTDVTSMQEGYITVTPLQFDLTHAARLDEMRGWNWRL